MLPILLIFPPADENAGVYHFFKIPSVHPRHITAFEAGTVERVRIRVVTHDASASYNEKSKP